MKLKKVTIEAFRAYKYKVDGTFDFTIDGNKPSNFVSIYAPNGFGKSSFYDAVEWAFTNNVSRYIGDTHKKSNDVAARSTKLEGIPQYILRNKDVDSTVETSVLVSTTEKEFLRKLNNIRVDSRDIKFNDRDTEKGTKSFRNIILSQDAIDRFVREVKPEDRYDSFMEHFDGNAEKARKNLHIMAHEVNSKLVQLKSRRSEIYSQIVNDVNEGVFVEYNNIVGHLLSLGETIQPISSDFSSIQELEIASSILSRKHQLNFEYKRFDALVESLQQNLDRTEEISDLLLKKLELEYEIKRISKGVEDNQRYQELYQLYLKKNKDKSVVLMRVNELKELESELPQFIKLYSVLEQCQLEQKNTYSAKVELESRIEKEAFSLKGIKTSISDQQINLRNLNELQANASNVYVEIASARQLISSLKSEIEALDNMINIDLASIDARRFDLGQIESFEVSVDALLLSDTSFLHTDSAIIFELSELRSKSMSYEKHLNDLLNIQDALTEQSSTIKRLVGLGLEHISLHPTKTCPLCTHEYLDEEDLKSAVISNSIASDALQSNSKMIENAYLSKEGVEQRIKEILAEVSKRKNQVIDNIRSTIRELEEKINKNKESRLHLNAKLSNAFEKMSSHNALVLSLEPTALEVRLKKDKEATTELLSKLVEDKSNTQEKLENLRSELNDLVVQIASCRGKELSIKQNALYIKFDNFIRSNATDMNKVSTVIYSFLSNSTATLEILKQDVMDAEERCQSLKTEIESEENWLDIEFLKARQSALSSKISDYNAQITPYFRVLSELIGDAKIQTEAEFKTKIEKKISTVRTNLERVNRILMSYELLENQLKSLVPHVQNISRRKEITQIEVEIGKYSEVTSILEEEIRNITTCLEDQIRSYFYTDLINVIYRKIDPHPAFKKVEFFPKFVMGERPQLNIVISDEQGNIVSPNLYFSSAQLNILSLSVFLAKAIHAKHNGKPLDVILIDDPIHSMDSINILSMIDMLRNISVQFDKQIIISTHDENFFELLQKKAPTEIFGSKFIALESYGVVAKSRSQTERV